MQTRDIGFTPFPQGNDSEPDLDLAEILKILGRRKRLLFWSLFGTILLALLFLIFGNRRYRAEAQLELLDQKPTANISDLAASGGDTDALQLGVTMQTYVGVLTSERLSIQVIDELHLENTSDFDFSIVSQEPRGKDTQALRKRPYGHT